MKIIINTITEIFNTLYNIFLFIFLKVKISLIPMIKDINVYKKLKIRTKRPIYVDKRLAIGQKTTTPIIKGSKAKLLTIRYEPNTTPLLFINEEA